ncbi:serine hydrolase domain-containing protein [Streptomyces reniochalinae]|uniref:Class A beta-lactamase-related serine hydrolase n=1 Tax=Streptomyces reniochalinae TaxID=2250578 RepID=A0A367EQL1_9ACTN|nr:serine hydrolase domain-containing protein [Streptomyces reniochalinae]RCG20408.1 class A beta-lactamase-related serine hydrolase [Streptomyces reniochalinae]
MRATSAQTAPHRPTTPPPDNSGGQRRAGRRWLSAAAAALATVSAAVVIQWPVDAHEAAAPGYGRAELRRDTDAIRALGVTGVQARVTAGPGRDLVATSGVAEAGTDRPVPRNGYFRMASTGKPLVAAVVLQLVGEGKLALDDTVDRWLPDLVEGNGNDGRRITIRHLLHHTSGIHDDELPGYTTPQEYHERRHDTYTPRRIVALATRHRSDFPPGTGWSYSNTGYVLLDMVIERVTGRPWHEEVKNRILEPLGMRHTYVPGSGTSTLRTPHANGYQVFPSGERVDVTDVILPSPGDHVSTTADVNRFFQALLGAELLPRERLAEMRETVPVNEEMQTFWPDGRYGLGLVSRPLSCGGSYWSHEGGDGGYVTLNGVTGDGSRSVTVSMSTALNGSPDSALRQERAASALVDHALCDTHGDGHDTSA